MSRPQVGIDRLPGRRMSNEPREQMNCKSCRKRKIKCNRVRPTCEACQVFACPCVYGAVPKKRGPKTDVLEALLKRVDGLEKRLQTDSKPDSPTEETALEDSNGNSVSALLPQHVSNDILASKFDVPALISPTDSSQSMPVLYPDLLLDAYFTRVHGKPYHILDEASTRQRSRNSQLPSYLAHSIYAVSARYTTHLGGYNAAVRLGRDYARRARTELDIDEPSIECLQALLLLAQANYQNGLGKKACMILSSGISMALALNLHRELLVTMQLTPEERESRRRLFWACYLLDRFAACGSKRPSLVSDESIVLRLPSWQMHSGGVLVEGNFFPNGSNLQYMPGPGKQKNGSSGMLIGIVRILGVTNRYLAAGGVKGDSHFPWHSLSNLSKIRQDLDIWASDSQDMFTSLEGLFGQPDSTVLVLGKLIYHLIHCLIYRPFLPVDLAELSGTGQHQPWQIEATNLCFLHANAIAELVEIGKASSIINWPAVVGYCVCTAGTIHVHGAHFGREGEVFSASAEFLSREMQQLSELGYTWAGIQHQRDTLRTVYGCHSELVKSLATNPLRFSPVFHLEDFFDRYPGQHFDGAHVTFENIVVDTIHERYFAIHSRRDLMLEPSSLSSYGTEHRSVLYIGSNTSSRPAFPQQPIIATQQSDATPTAAQPTRKKRRSTDISSSLPSYTTARTNDPSSSAIVDVATQQQHPPTANAQPPTDSTRSTPFQPNLASLSPNFALDSLAPLPPTSSTNFDPVFSIPTPSYQEQQEQKQGQEQEREQQNTLGTASPTSVHTDPDKDPFLSLLEQLAENEESRSGPSELDFFLSGDG